MGRHPKYDHNVILIGERPAKGQHVVYVYGNAEDVVYVGSTSWFDDRQRAHRRCDWWPEAETVRVEVLDSMEQMLAREIELIHTLDPLFNKTHKPRWFNGVACCVRCRWDSANGYWDDAPPRSHEETASLLDKAYREAREDADKLRRPA